MRPDHFQAASFLSTRHGAWLDERRAESVTLETPCCASSSFRSSSWPCNRSIRAFNRSRRRFARISKGAYWQPGCPVPLSQLRLLTVSHWGFDGRAHEGQLVVNQDVAKPLAKVFRRLYDLEFPIRHMRLGHAYGPRRAFPVDGDVSGSFECRQAVPSPCTGGSASGNWSNHAYGHAIDLNPVENPYVGCGRTRDPTRAHVRRSLPAAQGDGDARGRASVPIDRLGLGRRLER